MTWPPGCRRGHHPGADCGRPRERSNPHFCRGFGFHICLPVPRAPVRQRAPSKGKVQERCLCCVPDSLHSAARTRQAARWCQHALHRLKTRLSAAAETSRCPGWAQPRTSGLTSGCPPPPLPVQMEWITDTSEWHRDYYCAGRLRPHVPDTRFSKPLIVLVASDRLDQPEQQYMYVPTPVIIDEITRARGCTRQSAYNLLHRHTQGSGPSPTIDVSKSLLMGRHNG